MTQKRFSFAKREAAHLEQSTIRAIDLFAGAGGFTEGARAAGVPVVWAANHWPLAVDIHARNHPEVTHACQDLHQADWSKVPACNLVLASPCCQGHSKARGKERPHHDVSRSTAWAVVSCCEYHRPQAAIIENVQEFLDWSLYPAWELAMQKLGYQLSVNMIDAAQLGVPQHRERLFIVATLAEALMISPPRKRKLAAIGPHIDWSWPNWSPIRTKGRALATLERVAAGRKRFGRRFVMPYYGSGSGRTGRSLDRPLGTVTTRDRWAVVDGDRMRMLQPPEYQAAMSFPSDYLLEGPRDQQINLLGNAVCPPVAEFVVAKVATHLQEAS